MSKVTKKVTDKALVAKLKRKPKTAKELNVPVQRLYRMEASGLVQRVETRKQGSAKSPSRGRPSVVWSVA